MLCSTSLPRKTSGGRSNGPSIVEAQNSNSSRVSDGPSGASNLMAHLPQCGPQYSGWGSAPMLSWKGGIVSVELKAIIQLENVHLAQAINYLQAYDLEVRLLINFGARSLEFKRVTNKKAPP